MTRKETQELHSKIVAYVLRHPELKYRDMARDTGISHSTIIRVAVAAGVRRGEGRSLAVTTALLKALEQ